MLMHAEHGATTRARDAKSWNSLTYEAVMHNSQLLLTN